MLHLLLLMETAMPWVDTLKLQVHVKRFLVCPWERLDVAVHVHMGVQLKV
jgi:hypothetical protein